MTEEGGRTSRRSERVLRFENEDKLPTPEPRAERWTARHEGGLFGRGGLISGSTDGLFGRGGTGPLGRRSVVGGGSPAKLRKQGSLFATAAEDIQEDKGSARLYLIYKLEGWLSNRQAQYLALVLVGLTLVLLGALLWMLVQDEPEGVEGWAQGAFLEGLWVSWTFMADPGTHASVVDPSQRAVASLIAVIGIIFFAALLGVVVDVIRNKMDLLRQGRARVVEKNHSLILGWTEKSILLIEELCVANQSEGGGVIVVMAKHGKQDMEAELKIRLPKKHLLGSKVVFRSGSPLLTHDLIKVGAHRARSVIILADDNEPNKADAETLRCILVLRTMPYGLQGFIVAEVRDINNEPLLKLVGGNHCETVPSHDILGRLMVMAGRSPGLAKVYESLLGFAGDEFYMWEWPELRGLTFGELVGRFPDAIPIGLRHADGLIRLNPTVDTTLQAGDKLIVIAEDDDTYQPEPLYPIDEGEAPPYEEGDMKPEHIFIAGWRRDISDIFVHLDNMVEKGSELHMMTHCVSLEERGARLEDEGLELATLKNIKIVHHMGNTTVRRKVEALPLESCTSCMIFADQAFELDTMHADSHSLATLLLIRDTQMSRYEEIYGDPKTSELLTKCPIVCEILDPRTQKTIKGSIDMQTSSEFCHSNLMVAQIMAMVAENRSVKDLLDEMLGYSGCSVAVIPATRFAKPSERTSFWTLAKRASRRNTVLLGYSIRGGLAPPRLNPAEKTMAKNWDGHDLVALVPNRRGTQRGMSHRSWRRSTPDDSGAEERLSTAECEPKEPRVVRRFDSFPSEAVYPTHDQEPLETKVLKLVETCASLGEAERRHMGKVLDGLQDVIRSLPTAAAPTSSSIAAKPGIFGRAMLLPDQQQDRACSNWSRGAEGRNRSFSLRWPCTQEPLRGRPQDGA
uniref:RCK N-terminal domain-containing protein n=1 Tax=Alexandrium monilatum TaxID=311494 RepID=A0A7S4T4G9_9DINO|mmetsp:Transcript_77875/g.246038  ORF Transcript_77875/g.246038 Transcript_77875/m.246038 type:complete len:909 (-) Transcript_77875:135-2861(-)